MTSGRAFRLGFAPSRVRSFSLFRKKRDRLAPSRRSHNKKCGRDGACFSSTRERGDVSLAKFFQTARAAEKTEIFLPTRARTPADRALFRFPARTNRAAKARALRSARLRPSRALRRADPRVTRTRSRRAVRRVSARARNERERSRGTGTRGTSRGVRRPAVLGPGESASRDARRELIAAGARARDRGRPTRGLPSRFQ